MKRRPLGFVILLVCCFGLSANALASPWAEKQGYWAKTAGKFTFGLKNVVWSWTMPWIEAERPKYAEPWEGFCVGISRAVIYTANGLIHLVTFPIPVDFPDVGRGTGLYPKEVRGHYVNKPAAAGSMLTGSAAATSAPIKKAKPA